MLQRYTSLVLSSSPITASPTIRPQAIFRLFTRAQTRGRGECQLACQPRSHLGARTMTPACPSSLSLSADAAAALGSLELRGRSALPFGAPPPRLALTGAPLPQLQGLAVRTAGRPRGSPGVRMMAAGSGAAAGSSSSGSVAPGGGAGVAPSLEAALSSRRGAVATEAVGVAVSGSQGLEVARQDPDSDTSASTSPSDSPSDADEALTEEEMGGVRRRRSSAVRDWVEPAGARSEEEKEAELRRRWQHLPEPEGPGFFPECSSDTETPMWTSPVWASAIDVRRHIFCNRSLNMKSIEAVGFDMDYTIAQYRADTFEAFTYESAVQKLVHTFGYPDELLSWTFDFRYIIRGLVLDKKRGNILKMDRHKYVKVAYHGFSKLSTEERRKLYNSTRARESFDEPDYALIDTLFSLAEAYLFCQLVDFCDMFPERCPPNVVVPGSRHVNYEAMYKNVRSSVDICHRDGTLKSAVATDPSKYLSKDDQIVPMLKMMRASGRKIFLVTNSLWDYTHVVMNCVVGKCGNTPDTQRDLEWLKLFDVVITGSAKPAFFLDNSRAAMFEVDVHTGMLFNTDDGSPTAQIGDLPAPPMLKQKGSQGCMVYQGGSVAHLHRMLSIDSGSHVMYVGDHIYGDILRSKKTLGWRTMLVVPELVREVHVLHRSTDLQQAFHVLRHQIDSLDDAIQRLSWALRFDSLPLDKKRKAKQEMAALKVQVEEVREKYRSVMDQWHSNFHPVWGMLMKTGYQNSRFAHQVERFACLYTSHVANLAYYSPDKNYRTVEDYMPHEVDTLEN